MNPIITLSSLNDNLASLIGATFPSDIDRTVTYRIEQRLGEGASAVAFLATRIARDGRCSVVIKILKPVAAAANANTGNIAALSAQKEVAALSRLNEQTLLTPFVVRILDIGQLQILAGQPPERLDLPWLVLEYVHGGAAGTTLTERVGRCQKLSGFAFDLGRAARVIECLTSGLSTVHQAGVIHRDIKPANILCCGAGQDEIFKIADFGIARAEGIAATFGPAIVGSLGYAPPEQLEMRTPELGNWSDVFALAAVIYFVLTGERYFPPLSLGETARLVRSATRRSVGEAPFLHPALRRRRYDCKVIDSVLANATAPKPADRVQSAAELKALLQRVLPLVDSQHPSPAALISNGGREIENRVVDNDELSTLVVPWSWSVRHDPGHERGIRSVAWDSDGRALAATINGLRFWTGSGWINPPIHGMPNPNGIHFVQRLAPGRWLIGGEGATIATYSQEGATDVLRGPDPSVTFELAYGGFGDLAVLVGTQQDSVLALYAIAGRYWLKPFPLPTVATLNSITRIDEDRWLIAGRSRDGGGFVGVYWPTQWQLSRIDGCTASTYFSCSSSSSTTMALVAGSTGQVVLVDKGRSISIENLPEPLDLTVGLIDASGRQWVGGSGSIWLRQDGQPAAWSLAWHHESWISPFKSIYENGGRILAVTTDGGVLEGQADASVAG
jgi:serine/threonine protein kinase